MSRTLVILNPAARGARAMQERISALAVDAVVQTTSALGEAHLLAEKAILNGFSTVVAAGGDGTINEVVNGIADSNITLGILPIGTMNVFATELSLPIGNLEKCWEVIQSNQVREIDLPMANDRYVVQLAGIGLDDQAVMETSSDLKRTIGPFSYLISLAQIIGRKPPSLLVEYEGGKLEGSFVIIGNGRYYGGPFQIFKNAQIDDGLLDVIVCKNMSLIDLIRYLHGGLFGTHIQLPDVEYVQTARVTVSREQEVPVEVDGEVIGNLPVTFGFASHKLQVLAPW